jgi:hypothetical protein
MDLQNPTVLYLAKPVLFSGLYLFIVLYIREMLTVSAFVHTQYADCGHSLLLTTDFPQPPPPPQTVYQRLGLHPILFTRPQIL